MQVSVKDRKIIFYIQACVWMQVLFILLPCSMGNNSNWLQNCLIKLVCCNCYLPADIEFCIVPQHRLFYSWITKKAVIWEGSGCKQCTWIFRLALSDLQVSAGASLRVQVWKCKCMSAARPYWIILTHFLAIATNIPNNIPKYYDWLCGPGSHRLFVTL